MHQLIPSMNIAPGKSPGTFLTWSNPCPPPPPRAGRFYKNTPSPSKKLGQKPPGKIFYLFNSNFSILRKRLQSALINIFKSRDYKAATEAFFSIPAFSTVCKDSVFNIDIFIGEQINLLFQKWLHFDFAHLLSAKIITLYDCRCK